MPLGPIRRLRPAFALLTAAAFLFACASQSVSKKKKDPADPDDGDFFSYDDELPPEEPPLEPALVNEDSGAFGASSRPKDGGAHVDAALVGDAGVVTKKYCQNAVAPGDLAIVELLIASRAGAGDDGEWLEIRSTRDCWLNIKGVTVESPRGTAAPNVAKVETDLEIPPHGTFLVAGSADPAKNGALPGKVIAWGASDVLKNDGDTVVVRSGAVVVDTLTYPAFANLEAARSLAFPSDCPATARSDWQRWSMSFTARTVGGAMQRGTPNAENADVTCF